MAQTAATATRAAMHAGQSHRIGVGSAYSAVQSCQSARQGSWARS